MKDDSIRKIIFTGVIAALSYVIFTFLQIKITLPGGDATSIHLGNAVCVLGALLLGGFYGGLGGAIGMTIGDLLDPIYVVYAPKTFLLKLCIGLVTGLIAHKMGHITTETDSCCSISFSTLWQDTFISSLFSENLLPNLPLHGISPLLPSTQ